MATAPSTPKAIEEKLAQLPTQPGVYMMKSDKGEVIYVGKAKSLRNRVRTYFSGRDDGRAFTRHLVEAAADLDYVVTDTEKEALILENNLIKQFRPRYNIYFRDDKEFVSIRLDINEPWPRPRIVRQIKKDKALYFGPYASARSARQTLRFINNLFPIRKCSNSELKSRSRPCLYHQMGKCLGPCSDQVDEGAYRKVIDQVILILRGKDEDLLAILREQMTKASAGLRFEEAGRLRDQIAAIEKTVEGQKITSTDFVDRDIFGYYREGEHMEIQAMFVRRGRLQDLAAYAFSLKMRSPREVFESFLNLLYSQTRFIPKELLVPVETADTAALTEWLSERKAQSVEIVRPQRGEKKRLVELAMKNAEISFRARHGSAEAQRELLDGLREALGLRARPERIECFDISNIGGQMAVGSMVCFRDGVADKGKYRRFKIKRVKGADDFAMMREVLSRRYGKAGKEDLPDLAIIDGGKGQLNAAQSALTEAGVSDVDVVALAKARHQKGTEERVFKPGVSDPIVLPPNSAELLLLRRIRDEAHRFAIEYHRKVRQKKFIQSPLDQIPGIGPARKKALVRHFGNIWRIRSASIDELKQVKGISEKQAAVVYNQFHAEPTQTDSEAAGGSDAHRT